MALRDPKDIPGSVCLGVITGARGLKGEIKIKPFTDEPLGLGDYGPLHDGQGERLTVKPKSVAKGMLFAFVDGISDRTAADGLKGKPLYIERSALPEPGDDEFYHSDLIGLKAVTPDGEDFGTVKAVFDFGAGDVLELRGSAHGVVMMPFTKEAVPVIDLDTGRITVSPPPGLLEPAEPEPKAVHNQDGNDHD